MELVEAPAVAPAEHMVASSTSDAEMIPTVETSGISPHQTADGGGGGSVWVGHGSEVGMSKAELKRKRRDDAWDANVRVWATTNVLVQPPTSPCP